MRFALFYHSLVSDWNHGNAHFLRGIVTDLLRRGHEVRVYEPQDGWSLQNLRAEQGERPLDEFRRMFPHLDSQTYQPATIDLETELADVDVVLVHEWNDRDLVARIGTHRAESGGYVLLFHDTHHRSVTAPEDMAAYDLQHYDGVLAFGEIIRRIYLENGWAKRVWTWHEAADATLFRPLEKTERAGDVVWIGNWGDGERSEELGKYLIDPVKSLGLHARVYGVRYPEEGRRALSEAGIEFAGWLPNYRVPEVFARFKATLHIPRRPYREVLHGIPTIRVFEALACGIPLVCLRWTDSERLFHPGEDYLIVDTPKEMIDALQSVLHDPNLADRLSAHGLETIREKHTCTHRVCELLEILQEISGPETAMADRNTMRISRASLEPGWHVPESPAKGVANAKTTPVPSLEARLQDVPATTSQSKPRSPQE